MSNKPTYEDLTFLIENTSVLFYVCDLAGRLIRWNKAVEIFTGFSPDEIMHRSVLELVADKDQELLQHGIQQILQSGFFTAEICLVDKNGTTIPFLCKGTAIKNKNGELVGFAGTGHNIREQIETIRGKNLLRQQQINKLQVHLLGPRSLEDKMHLVTDGVVDAFNADFCRIWVTKQGDLCDSGCPHNAKKTGPDICHNQTACLHLIASSGRYTHIDGGHRRIPTGAFKIGRLASGPHTKFLTNNVTEDQQIHDRHWAKELGLKSFVGYQLRNVFGKTVGVFALFSKQVIEPEEDVLLENLGNNIAQVIQTSMAEESLKESEERYRTLSNNIPGMIYRGNRDWSSSMVLNSRMICGYSEDEFLTGKINWLEIIHPDDKPWILESGCKLAEHAMSLVQEYRIIVKNGCVRWVSDHKTSFFSKDGTFIGIDGILFDITERKQAEEKLQMYQESLERQVMERTFELERAIEELRLQGEIAVNMSEGVFLFQVVSGTIIYTNPRFEKIFGYGVGEMVGKHASILYTFPQPNSLAEIDQFIATIKKTGVWQGETKTIKKDGTLFWCYASASLFEHPEYGETVVSVHSDITDRKQMEEKLREAKQVAEMANKAKSDFLANMSHEIRTPLNAIIGMSRLASKADLLPEPKYYIDIVRQSGEILLGLINDILDISKIEAGQIKLEEHPFNLQELVNAIVKMFTSQAQEKDIDISARIVPNIPFRLSGDEYRVRQILTNLVGNAIKFTDKGQITISVDAIEHNDVGEAAIQFSVADTGTGIPFEAQEKIFGSFFQADSSVTRIHGGTGLGLTITKKLTKLMGGRIWFTSEPGQGSTFSFTVRLRTSEVNSDFPKTNTRFLAPASPLPSLEILLVEDNQFNRELARIILIEKGHRVTSAGNGLEALKFISRKDFDVVLMDVQMPEMDGITATKLIRQCEVDGKIADKQHLELLVQIKNRIKGVHLPIIAMTAQAMSGDREACIKAGMNDYISKPFHPDEIFGVLHRVTAP